MLVLALQIRQVRKHIPKDYSYDTEYNNRIWKVWLISPPHTKENRVGANLSLFLILSPLQGLSWCLCNNSCLPNGSSMPWKLPTVRMYKTLVILYATFPLSLSPSLPITSLNQMNIFLFLIFMVSQLVLWSFNHSIAAKK